jgi:phosphatidate cytidylyltransferase
MGAAGGGRMAGRVPRPRSRRDRDGGGGSGGGGSDLSARLIVAVPAIAYAIAIIAFGRYWFALGILPLAIIAIGELFDLYADAEPVRLAGFLGVTALILAAYLGDGFHVLLTFVAFFPVLFAITLVQRRAGTIGMAITVFGVAWIGLALAHGVLLRELPHGGGIIVDILVGTFIGDSGAYIGGRWFGRRKLAPSVSPNKTLEGLAIGMFTALLATWLAGTYQDWLSGTDALLLGVGVALAAPAGDLFESFVKRDAGTKDSGRLFGAHGGALDRLDAVFFTAVVGYYLWLVLL